MTAALIGEKVLLHSRVFTLCGSLIRLAVKCYPPMLRSTLNDRALSGQSLALELGAWCYARATCIDGWACFSLPFKGQFRRNGAEMLISTYWLHWVTLRRQ